MKKLLTFIFCLVQLISCTLFGSNLPASSEKELKDNYNKKHKEIMELKNYFNSIAPKDLEVYIEFSSDKSIDLIVYYLTTPKYPRKIFFQQWNMNPYDLKPSSNAPDMTMLGAETNSFDAVKKRLSWTDETFETIKKYLDNANCISVTNGNPTNIGFKRSGMGKYFYNLFDRPLNDSLKKFIMTLVRTDCTTIQ